jgi:hypothetical protein
MRLKFLSVIVGFLSISILIGSCLGSDASDEYSTDATIKAFALDTIYGVTYPFTIDQLQNLIYNADSMPVGADTVVDRILVKTLTVGGWVTLRDTAVTTTDSIDLSGAINPATSGGGLELKTRAADAATTRSYHLQLRIHRQDPDSLVWAKMPALPAVPTEPFKAVVADNDRLLVYTSHTRLYEANAADGANLSWETHSVSGLPATVKLGSILHFKGRLYAAATNGRLYASTDGTAWSTVAVPTGVSVTNTVAYTADSLTLIGSTGGTDYFYTTADATAYRQGDAVPDGFPTDNYMFTPFAQTTALPQLMLVGNGEPAAKAVVPWVTTTGSEWVDFSTPTGVYCPALSNPTVIYYGEGFYITGGDLSTVYYSEVGIAWNATRRKFLLPPALKGSARYSSVVDAQHFWWIITPDAVWRGRLNKLGFENSK